MLTRPLRLRGPCKRHWKGQLSASSITPAQLPAQQQQQRHRGSCRLHATEDDSTINEYRPDELADYEEILRQKKEAKQQALQDLKRKRKFNPLHAKLKISAAEQADEAAAHTEVDDSASSTPGASRSSSSNAAGPRFAARPRAAASALRQQQQQAPVAAQRQAAAEEEAEVEQLPVAVELLKDDNDLDSAGYPSDSVLGKMLAELMEGEVDDDLLSTTKALEDVPEVQPLTAKVQRRKTPAQMKAAALTQRALQQRLQRKRQAAAEQQQEDDDEVSEEEEEEEESAEEKLMHAIASIQQQQQSGSSTEAAAAAGEGEDQDDDLDWEALGQYEQLEQYLGRLKKDQQIGVGPRRAATAPAALPAMGVAAAASKAVLPPAAKQPPTAHQLSTPAAAAAAAGAAAAQTSKPAAADTAGSKSAKRGRQADAMMDKDLDELEELAALLEAMEAGTSNRLQQQQSLARKPALPTASAASSKPPPSAAAADPGDTLLKALLGDDWEAELLDDLAAVIDDDEDEPSPQKQQQARLSSSSAAAGFGTQQQPAAINEEDDQEAPWADEVTALLLGLITISHEKYIKSQIPLTDFDSVGEDERCAAFWRAPWALFMVDDSSESAVEYVNEAAGKMFGGAYLDLFGQPTHELVAPELTAQADWAYAVRQVEESAQFSVRLPQLQLQDVTGQPVIAHDVTMWRVDSLEDTPIGMAVLVKKWDRGE